MTLVVKLENCTIELEGHQDLPGDPGQYTGPWGNCRPSEAPAYEWIKALVVRHGREKKISARKAVAAIERRLGSRWEERALEDYDKS